MNVILARAGYDVTQACAGLKRPLHFLIWDSFSSRDWKLSWFGERESFRCENLGWTLFFKRKWSGLRENFFPWHAFLFLLSCCHLLSNTFDRFLKQCKIPVKPVSQKEKAGQAFAPHPMILPLECLRFSEMKTPIWAVLY